MNLKIKETIEKCAHELHVGPLNFPDYRDQSTTYYLSDNNALRVSMDMPHIEIPALFDKEGVVCAIHGA